MLIVVTNYYYINYIGEIEEYEWDMMTNVSYEDNKIIEKRYRSIDIFGFQTDDGFTELYLKFDNIVDLISLLGKLKNGKITVEFLSDLAIDRIIEKMDLIEIFI